MAQNSPKVLVAAHRGDWRNYADNCIEGIESCIRMGVDIAPKRASGAALGIAGVASYIGAGIQDIRSRRFIGDSKTVVDGIAVYDFSAIRYFWTGAAALSFILCACLWKNPIKASESRYSGN